MDLQLKDKVVIVTGGCSGIGWGITQVCVKEGASVIACQRSENGAERIAGLVAEGYSAEFKRCDVSDPESIKAFVSDVIEKHGRVDALINNAGVTIEMDFFEMPLDKLDLLWATNLRSVFLMTQEVGRHMKDNGGGSVVNISSNHSSASVAGYDMYAATKGGISAMTRAMAWSLGKHGIRVNTLSPGLTMTEAVQDVMDSDPRLEKVFTDMHATQRVSSVEDVANIAAFLASDKSSCMTGTDVVADQGLVAQLCRVDDLK